jgi:hypothetical protein
LVVLAGMFRNTPACFVEGFAVEAQDCLADAVTNSIRLLMMNQTTPIINA